MDDGESRRNKDGDGGDEDDEARGDKQIFTRMKQLLTISIWKL